jgi:putative FmdB family regulatory protein
MPIYAYRCDNCGATKDVLQKLSDAPLSVCPVCGSPTFRKQLSAPAFQLKGTGWYVTDFRDNDKPKHSASDKASGDSVTAEKSGGASNVGSGGSSGSGSAEPASPPAGAAGSGAAASAAPSQSPSSTAESKPSSSASGTPAKTPVT